MISERINTIDIAETTGFALLGVVKTTGPVHRDVAFGPVESGGTLHTSTGADATKLKQTVEYRTVVSHIVFTLLLNIRVHVVGCHPLEELYVFVRVELRHLCEDSGFRALMRLEALVAHSKGS